MEPLKKDPPNKGRYVKTLIIISKISSSYMDDSMYRLQIRDTLSINDRCFDFILVPKCPLFRGFTVVQLPAESTYIYCTEGI